MHCLVLIVALGFVALCSATQVRQCSNGNIPNIHEKVTIGNCVKPPCRLIKNTKIPLTLKFQPERDFKNLRQKVHAKILGLPFPFYGVDGTSACDKIYEEDEKTPNNCQFEKGKTYVFKHEIAVLPEYPNIKTVVQWALEDSLTGENAICFEVPARIAR